MTDAMHAVRVGDVISIGKGRTLWTVVGHQECDYPEVVVHLFDLRSQSGRKTRLDLRSDNQRVTLVWTLEEIVLGADVLEAAS